VPAWRNDRATGGGALFEIAVHHFDLWRYLLGADFELIQAQGRNGEWQDETVAVTARLTNGALASGVFSERSGDHNKVAIVGREGRLALDLYRFDGFTFTPADAEPGLAARLRGSVAATASLPHGVALMRQGGDFLLSYRRQWQAFLAALDGGDYAGASAEDGAAAVRAVLAAIQSADGSGPVKP
jgi:predicted dehydrogenase